MVYNYLIIGCGLAGISLSEQLYQEQDSFFVIDGDTERSTSVAGGIFNPIMLKRFSLAWEADKQLPYALDIYKRLENLHQTTFIHELPIYRKFNGVEEQNNWFVASDKPGLNSFLSSTLTEEVDELCSKFKFGEVKQTGYVNTALLQKKHINWLKEENRFSQEKFDYQQLHYHQEENIYTYKTLRAKHIIFAEGVGLRKNPFFNWLPLKMNKGEYIVVEAPEFKLSSVIKAGMFVLPLGNNYYKIGATYDNTGNDYLPTSEKKKQLIQAFEEISHKPYTLIDQEVGLRPATADRRPFLGKHPKNSNMYVCNGFGSRGVLIAPTAAKQLLCYINGQADLPEEVDITRYAKLI
ncbi:glycine/D-amino acid oxidase-like deaminating enzyme [Mesonia hippocampi]|uniref:Glycine/D-amino acid oxidase-like deaminating enzyme n=1 Tax=Mesonia hippocampi TaxID=1628250 RepID=A0A840EHF7_9FLAO|nr:FAD-dependent oxidoreductase [Mesonia hippocampi]MBB4118732.1 glycine/D-amino acid oxidase-like deaminating enzyme [Mesonia hippocampi]